MQSTTSANEIATFGLLEQRRLALAHKYAAKKITCRQGHKHPSKKEAGWCDALHIDQADGKISELKLSPFFPFVIDCQQLKHSNGRKVGYTSDFQFTENARTVVCEVKGMSVRDWPLRKAVFEALYPNIELRVV